MNAKSNPETKQLEKYKELFLLSKEVFSEELGRSVRIDDKASKYFTVITFLLGGYAFFCKRILDFILPPKSYLEWIIVILAASLLLFLVIAWFVILGIFKIHEFKKIPIDIDFFDNHNLLEVYYGLSKGIKINLNINREKINQKSRKLYHGYNLIRIIVIILITLSIVFAIHAWLNPGNKSNLGIRSTAMAEEPKNPQAEKPPEVTPPNFDIVTEGFDPTKSKKKEIEIRDKKID